MINPLEIINNDRLSARSLEDANAELCYLALSETGSPSVRTLILRTISNDGLTVFINKTSAKWRTISKNDEAEMLIWYPSLQRQYRIHGVIEELDRAAIEQNWPRRPAGSKYLDHATMNFQAQTQTIDSHAALASYIKEFRETHPEDSLTTPEVAAGIILRPEEIECLDLNSPDRLHDRRRYTLVNGEWKEAQLMP